MSSTDTELIKNLDKKGFPTEVTKECLADKSCRKKIIDRYINVLSAEEGIKYETQGTMAKIAEECAKDPECRKKSQDLYLQNIAKRNTSYAIDNTSNSIRLVYRVIKWSIFTFIFIVLAIFVWNIFNPAFWQSLLETMQSLVTALQDFATAVGDLLSGFPTPP